MVIQVDEQVRDALVHVRRTRPSTLARTVREVLSGIRANRDYPVEELLPERGAAAADRVAEGAHR